MLGSSSLAASGLSYCGSHNWILVHTTTPQVSPNAGPSSAFSQESPPIHLELPPHVLTVDTLNRSWSHFLHGKRLPSVKSLRVQNRYLHLLCTLKFHSSHTRTLWCRPGKECYSHFTGEGTRPQRSYLSSNGRKLQSELNLVFILSFSSKIHTITKTQAVSLPLFPILCVLPLAVSCGYTVSHCLGYCSGVLLRLADSISWSSKKHWFLPPHNPTGYLFYVVAFPEEGFNASYLKTKHRATPESFTGCPCPPAILLALPGCLSWITSHYSRYQLEILCQPDSLLLHFINLCSSLYFFPSTVLGFIGSSSTFKDGNANYWFQSFFLFKSGHKQAWISI